MGLADQTVYNGAVPQEGAKGVPVSLDFTSGSSFAVDLTTLRQAGAFSFIQTIYADNSKNPAPILVSIPVTSQTLVIPPNTCGYFPVLCTAGNSLSFFCGNSIVVGIILLNFPMAASPWPAQGAGITDAPANGQAYVRENNSWVVNPSLSEAPATPAGSYWAREGDTGTWVQVGPNIFVPLTGTGTTHPIAGQIIHNTSGANPNFYSSNSGSLQGFGFGDTVTASSGCRWSVGKNGSGGTSSFVVNRFGATGTLIDAPLSIEGATGIVTFLDGISCTGSSNFAGTMLAATIGVTSLVCTGVIYERNEQVVTTGTAVAVGAAMGNLIFNFGSTVPAMAITMPASPLDGRILTISNPGAALTLVSFIGTVSGQITTLATGAFARYMFNTALATWIRVG